MSIKNYYKPRNTIVYVTKSKVWPAKNAYLRRFYAIRGRYLRREHGLFRRCVLVATSRKWLLVRRFIRPIRQSVRSRQIASRNKKAYGRPYKQRYRNMFYAKQQLRLFHGEVKEGSFLKFFRNHLSATTVRNKSFFSAIESRLDRIFFRIRLLPTIFACRQFIIHQGLEVNLGLEKSPRALIRTGDMIAVPQQAWTSMYWELLRRIYYRRWGLYIRRRRIYKQRKKILFFVRHRSYVQSKQVVSSQKLAQKGKNVVPTFTRLSHLRFSFNQSKTNRSDRKKMTKYAKHIDSESIKSFMVKLFDISPSSGIVLRQLFSQYNAPFFKRLNSTKKQSNATKSLQNSKLSQGCKIPPALTIRATDRVSYIKEKTAIGEYDKGVVILTQKLHHYKKLALSLRLRKITLPRNLHYISKGQQTFAHQSSKQTKLLRFYFKKYKKTIQKKKIIRLKGVHFFIPSYLQRDFRTLRAIKVQSPSPKDTFYPFRISLPKRYAFYRSRGY